MSIFCAVHPSVFGSVTPFNECYNVSATVYGTTAGRNMLFFNGENDMYNGIQFPSAVSTFIYQGFVYFDHATNGGTILRAKEDTTTHFRLDINTSNQVVAYRNTTILGTSTLTVERKVWYYLQVKCVIHDTTGSVVVKINGVEYLNLTSQDTRNGLTGIYNRFTLGRGPDVHWGEFFVADESAGFNDLSTDILYISIVNPTGVGNSTQWTPSAGSNWQTVDEVPLSESDYNSSSTDTHKDTFATDDISTSIASILCVIPFAIGEMTSEDGASLEAKVRHSTSESSNTPMTLKNASLSCVMHYAHVNPSTTAAWTAAGVNAMETGYELSV